MSKITELVGERIRSFRQKRGLSQEQLAFKASLNTSFVGQVERGSKSPTVDSLEKIAMALEITLEELFSFEQTKLLEADTSIIEKITFQLHGRTKMEQEAIYNLIKQILSFKDQK